MEFILEIFILESNNWLLMLINNFYKMRNIFYLSGFFYFVYN